MLNHKTVKVLHEKRGSKFASNRLWVLLFSMNLLSLISDVLLISPCSVKYVQIVHNNMQFAKVVSGRIFIELKNRCFVYHFTGAKLIGFMTTSLKKD